jgi:hypothetical protein
MSTKEVPQTVERDKERAHAMALAEHPTRTMARNAEAKGLSDLAQRFEKQAESLAVLASEKYDAERQQLEQEINEQVVVTATKIREFASEAGGAEARELLSGRLHDSSTAQPPLAEVLARLYDVMGIKEPIRAAPIFGDYLVSDGIVQTYHAPTAFGIDLIEEVRFDARTGQPVEIGLSLRKLKPRSGARTWDWP